MSRYGNWPSMRDGFSPFASQTDEHGIPQVTDEDYSYITSEDLERSTPRTYEPDSRYPPPSYEDEEDDVLMIKHQGASYPVLFPAYSIGDGKVYVSDVRDRIALIMKLEDRYKRHVKMLYKGRHLKTPEKPIRDYGVKNNSELLLIIPEGKLDDGDEEGASSGTESEEVVVADAREERKARKTKKTKGKKKKRKDQAPPRDSASHLNIPDRDGRSPPNDGSRQPSRVSSPAVPQGPLEQLKGISDNFEADLLPQCRGFIAKPPTDPKKCEDEHRKLSETVMQHVLLKLDAVDTGGDPEIRTRRKELVNRVNEVLKHIDEVKRGATSSKR